MPARLVDESKVEFLVNARLVGWVGVADDIAEIAQRVEELLNGFFGGWLRTGWPGGARASAAARWQSRPWSSRRR